MPEITNKVGRPSVDVIFPERGEFGIAELAQSNPKVSRVTLQLKVNQAIERQTLRRSGFRKNGKGRPAKLFTRI
jgi:hypothetical protein